MGKRDRPRRTVGRGGQAETERRARDRADLPDGARRADGRDDGRQECGLRPGQERAQAAAAQVRAGLGNLYWRALRRAKDEGRRDGVSEWPPLDESEQGGEEAGTDRMAFSSRVSARLREE